MREICAASLARSSIRDCDCRRSGDLLGRERGIPGLPIPRRALPALETVVVEQGDVTLVVTENGSLESSVDDVIRCRVESFQAAGGRSRRKLGATPVSGTNGEHQEWRSGLGIGDPEPNDRCCDQGEGSGKISAIETSRRCKDQRD